MANKNSFSKSRRPLLPFISLWSREKPTSLRPKVREGTVKGMQTPKNPRTWLALSHFPQEHPVQLQTYLLQHLATCLALADGAHNTHSPCFSNQVALAHNERILAARFAVACERPPHNQHLRTTGPISSRPKGVVCADHPGHQWLGSSAALSAYCHSRDHSLPLQDKSPWNSASSARP